MKRNLITLLIGIAIGSVGTFTTLLFLASKIQVSPSPNANTINIDNMVLPEGTGISGAIVSSSGVVYFQRGNPQLNEDSIYEIGSITKVFTALAIALHDSRNPGYLSTSVGEVLTTASGSQISDITLKDLLNHSSGIPRLAPSFSILHILMNRSDPYADYLRDDLYADISATELSVKAGSFEYSNYAFWIAGLCLEQSTSMDYRNYILNELLLPLGMTSSFVGSDSGTSVTLTQGYDDKGKRTNYWTKEAAAPAGSIKSSTKDMGRFIAAYIQGTQPDLREALEAITKPTFDVSNHHSVGLGWQIRKTDSEPVIWHNGATGGFRSFIAISPENNLGVVLLCNYAGVEGLDKSGFDLLTGKTKIAEQNGDHNSGSSAAYIVRP